MSEITPTKVLDVKNKGCPFPVLKTKKAMKELNVGDILEVIATDPGSMSDIPAWASATGQELLKKEQIGDEYHFWIKKTK